MTNTDLVTEVLNRLERMQTGGATLPRDAGNPPTITFDKMAGRIDIFRSIINFSS
jgi:hypothetical protein